VVTVWAAGSDYEGPVLNAITQARPEREIAGDKDGQKTGKKRQQSFGIYTTDTEDEEEESGAVASRGHGKVADNRNSGGRGMAMADASMDPGMRKKVFGKTSQYRGVYFDKKCRKRWAAEVRIGGKQVRCGCYESEYEAALVREQKARQHPGKIFCNFPDDLDVDEVRSLFKT